jgi:hypothetical protein
MGRKQRRLEATLQTDLLKYDPSNYVPDCYVSCAGIDEGAIQVSRPTALSDRSIDTSPTRASNLLLDGENSVLCSVSEHVGVLIRRGPASTFEFGYHLQD